MHCDTAELMTSNQEAAAFASMAAAAPEVGCCVVSVPCLKHCIFVSGTYFVCVRVCSRDFEQARLYDYVTVSGCAG